MKPSKTSGRRVANLFVRSLAPTGGRHSWQEKVVRRLDDLVAAGVLADYTVHIWGDRVVPESRVADTDAGQFVRDHLAAFEGWTRGTECSFGPHFGTHAVDSEFSGERYTVMELPDVTLAEYHDDELRFVTPCVDSDRHYSVSDRLDILKGGNRRRRQSTGGSPNVDPVTTPRGETDG